MSLLLEILELSLLIRSLTHVPVAVIGVIGIELKNFVQSQRMFDVSTSTMLVIQMPVTCFIKDKRTEKH